jgi:REP element-mobilizing transposase RayT
MKIKTRQIVRRLEFVPKAIFRNVRRQLGPIFHALAKQKECQILAGHLMADHVHLWIAIPPKHPVASVTGFLKGESANAIARRSGDHIRIEHRHETLEVTSAQGGKKCVDNASLPVEIGLRSRVRPVPAVVRG